MIVIEGAGKNFIGDGQVLARFLGPVFGEQHPGQIGIVTHPAGPLDQLMFVASRRVAGGNRSAIYSGEVRF